MLSDNTDQRVLSASLRNYLANDNPRVRSPKRGMLVAYEIEKLVADDEWTDDIRSIACELAEAGNSNGVDSVYLFDGQFTKMDRAPYESKFAAEDALIERIFGAAQSPSRLNMNLTRTELEHRIEPLFKASAVSDLRDEVWQFEDNLLSNRVRRGVTKCQEEHHPDYPDPGRTVEKRGVTFTNND